MFAVLHPDRTDAVSERAHAEDRMRDLERAFQQARAQQEEDRAQSATEGPNISSCGRML